jgi:hypothetical protein
MERGDAQALQLRFPALNLSPDLPDHVGRALYPRIGETWNAGRFVEHQPAAATADQRQAERVATECVGREAQEVVGWHGCISAKNKTPTPEA